MEPAIRISRAERTGGALGRLWKKYVRLDRKWCDWLIARRLSAGWAKPVLWIVKLVVLGVLFYAVFWVALVIVIAMAVAWLAQNVDTGHEIDKPEWREGHSGFGLYDKSEWRHDMGDPDKP